MKQTFIWKNGREMQRKCTLYEIWLQLSPNLRMEAKRLFGSPFRSFYYDYHYYFNSDYKTRRYWYNLTQHIQYWVPYSKILTP